MAETRILNPDLSKAALLSGRRLQRDGVPLWMARMSLMNGFRDLKSSGTYWAWWTQILLVTLVLVCVVAGSGMALRPLAVRWATAFSAVSLLLAIAVGVRRGMVVPVQVGHACAPGWMDVLSIPIERHWASMRRVCLLKLAAESFCIALAAAVFGVALGAIGWLLAASVVAFALTATGTVWYVVANKLRSDAHSFHECYGSFRSAPTIVRPGPMRLLSRSGAGMAWISTWQWRLPAVQRGKGIVMVAGIFMLLIGALLARSEQAIWVMPVFALVFAHGLAYFLLRQEPAVSPAIRVLPLRFPTLAISLVRWPFVASAGGFVLFAALASFLGLFSIGPWLASAFGLLGFNLLAAACFLATTSRFEAGILYLVTVAAIATFAQSIGPLALAIMIGAILYLFARARRRHDA